MNIESLPKNSEVNGVVLSLAMHVTAWNKLCLCYKPIFKGHNDSDKYVLSQVVEPEMTANPEFSECIWDIVDVPTFDKAVEMMSIRIKDALANNKISVYNP